MNIAKVTLPIAVDRAFDYIAPGDCRVKKGARVLVDFGGRKKIGIVTGTAKTSKIKKIKPLISVIDQKPLLTAANFKFARALSESYPYPAGDFLFMMLPPALRKRAKLHGEEGLKDKNNGASPGKAKKTKKPAVLFVSGESFSERYAAWKDLIKEKLDTSSVLICFPQITHLEAARSIVEKDFPGKIQVITSGEKNLTAVYQNSRSKTLILGTMVSLLYHPDDLGMIIVEEENSPYYRQQEKPFYNLADAAGLLCRVKGISLVLSSLLPRMSTYRYIRNGKIRHSKARETPGNIRVVDIKAAGWKKIVGPVAVEIINRGMQTGKKTVVIWRKNEFSSAAACSACGYVFTCDRCSAQLKFSQKENSAICPFCKDKKELPGVCPECKGGYVRKLGVGIERLEVILKSIFPEAKVNNISDLTPQTQVILATPAFLDKFSAGEKFDTGLMLEGDYFLSQAGYAAAEEAFVSFNRLASFFRDKLYVFTRHPENYVFKALGCGWKSFYDKELSLRKELSLPPYATLAKITVRLKNENKLLLIAEGLYNRLLKEGLSAYAPVKESPFKLRGNFRYTVVVSSDDGRKLRRVIKSQMQILRAKGVMAAGIIEN